MGCWLWRRRSAWQRTWWAPGWPAWLSWRCVRSNVGGLVGTRLACLAVLEVRLYVCGLWVRLWLWLGGLVAWVVSGHPAGLHGCPGGALVCVALGEWWPGWLVGTRLATWLGWRCAFV